MEKTVIRTNKQETQPIQQVIERVIVKTEQVETIKVLKTVDELKEQLKQDVKTKFDALSVKPRVEATIVPYKEAVLDVDGVTVLEPEVEEVVIYVDGGRVNKDDFKTKWELMADTDTTAVKDADNNFHTDITKEQMFLIWTAIVANGEALYNWKWTKEAEIDACTTIAELEAIEV